MKKTFPNYIWKKIRKIIIIHQQSRALRSVEPIFDYVDKRTWSSYMFIPKKVFPENSKIIWQYWAQGFNNRDCPELVKICIDSIDYYAEGYTIIRISDENIEDYVDLPDFVKYKRKNFSITHFSDLLRTLLLSVYGGLWLDASVLLTGKLSDSFFKGDFFVYQRDNNERYKSYWEKSFAYYWGWSKKFKVKSLVGIMSSSSDSIIMRDICCLMLELWKRYDKIPHYFVFSIIIGEYFLRNRNLQIEIYNDTVPHILRQHINGVYPYLSIEKTLQLTSIHSLNYKNPQAVIELREILKEYRSDFYMSRSKN